MENKPLHFDGSVASNQGSEETEQAESFKITAEARKNIAGNPFEAPAEE